MRSAARYIVDVASAAVPWVGSRGVTMLMYHRVLPDASWRSYPQTDLVVPETAFRRQMQWLAGRRRVMTVAEALEAMKTSAQRLRDCVCVTFDDGFKDNAEVAAPILEEYGLRGTFFVTTGFLKMRTLLWFDLACVQWQSTPGDVLTEVARRNAEADATLPVRFVSMEAWLGFLKGLSPEGRARILKILEERSPAAYNADLYAPMTVEQLQSLRRKGHEIGAHTETHPRLPQLDDDALWRELSEPRRELMEWTGTDVPGLCYPNGDHDERVVHLAAKAGYRYACTTIRGRNTGKVDPMRLMRRRVTFSSVSTPGGRPSDVSFAAEVRGLHDDQRAVLRRCIRFATGFGRRKVQSSPSDTGVPRMRT